MLYPFFSCTAAVPLSEDKHMTEGEARNVSADRPSRDAFSLQESCEKEPPVVARVNAISPAP